jgi:saccharopine dehydrogenase-like NADP-dependent oxidoreductase
VLGGTGRVGGSTATALSKLCPELKIVVGGRNREKGEAMVAKLGENSEFSQVDINDAKMLETSLRDVDLVVHAAGPFQQAPRCTVLEAAIKTKVRIRLHISMFVMTQAMLSVQNLLKLRQLLRIFRR